jgi:hypothetical protein
MTEGAGAASLAMRPDCGRLRRRAKTKRANFGAGTATRAHATIFLIFRYFKLKVMFNELASWCALTSGTKLVHTDSPENT